MKKASELSEQDPLAPRPNLDFSKGVRGKHYRSMREGSNVVVIDADLLDSFPDSASVNRALRVIKTIAHRSAETGQINSKNKKPKKQNAVAAS